MTRPVDESRLVAPCGMNCRYCYAALRNKKPCPGCLQDDEGKPNHCRICKIKACATDKGMRFCSSCPDYPCVLVKRLDKSYRTRYGESLVTNLAVIAERGMAAYLAGEKERLRCPACGGVLNLHHKICSECGGTFETESLEEWIRNRRIIR